MAAMAKRFDVRQQNGFVTMSVVTARMTMNSARR
jgi:hypothetical protein